MGEVIGLNRDFESRFKKTLSDIAEQSFGEEVMDVDFQELGINSIAFVRLIVALENEFDVEFDDGSLDVNSFTTLRQLLKYAEECWLQAQ